MDFARAERVNDGEEAEIHGGIQGAGREGSVAWDQTVQQIGAKHEVHPNQVSQWKRKASEGLVELFERGPSGERQALEAEIKKLHEKIGQLVVERDFLKSAWER